jgi:hypothetical protein
MRKLLITLLCTVATTNVFAKVVTKTYTESSPTKFYSINIQYPYINPKEKISGTEAFNHAIRNFKNNQVAAFKKDLSPAARLKQMSERIKNIPLNKNSNSLTIKYKLMNDRQNIVSILFDISKSYYGAAHPSPATDAINYDLSTHKNLTLADLFAPNSQYLKVLSAASRKVLIEKIIVKGPHNPNIPIKKLLNKHNFMYATILRGTAPIAKNYQFWTISQQGLKITFPTYQVAPYYFGPQTVIIPKSDLQNILRKNSPLAK